MQLGNDQDKNFSYFQLIIKMLIPTYTYLFIFFDHLILFICHLTWYFSWLT